MKSLDPAIWFPALWFFLRNVAHTYPDYPNEVTKRKYYDFIQNLPLFIPHIEWQKQFSQMLESFPVSPYLANRDSFFFWIHFMQNRVHRLIGKEEYVPHEYLEEHYQQYLPKPIIISRSLKLQKKYVIYGFTVLLLFCIMCIYLQ